MIIKKQSKCINDELAGIDNPLMDPNEDREKNLNHILKSTIAGNVLCGQLLALEHQAIRAGLEFALPAYDEDLARWKQR